MNIQKKLLALIICIVMLLSGAAAVYVLMSFQSARMESEKQLLSALLSKIDNFTIALDRVPHGIFADELIDLVARKDELNLAFGRLSSITVLPGLREDVRKSLDAIMNLKDLIEKRMAGFAGKYAAVLQDSTLVFPFTKRTSTIMDYYTAELDDERRQYMVDRGKANLEAFMRALDGMHNALRASNKVIAEQFGLIDGEVQTAKNQAYGIALVLVAGIILFTLVISILFANSIARSIIQIERTIALLKSGNLTGRTVVKSRDEIGVLARNLNQFTDSLADSIREIASVSLGNIEMKNDLISAANEEMVAINEISANTGAIADQIRELDQRIGRTNGSIGRIVAGIGGLRDEMAVQKAMTEDATAAVTETLASLDNMSGATARDRQSVGDLVRVAERGRKVFVQANEKMVEIDHLIATIQDMAGIIGNIAAQTNLLAMNAAIEAAHAGDSGRGFAVVAGEIRKLAEASNHSSRDISESIKIIVDRILQATQANVDTGEAFSAIEDKIRIVSSSMDGMFHAIAEIQLGSHQILKSMAELKERSVSITANAQSMEGASAEIRLAMSDVGRISSELTSNISEISAGVDELGKTTGQVVVLSEKVGTGSMRLDEEMQRFKLA